MPITILCPHDKAELVLVPDEKTPDGLLKCPKCGCIFRVCLAVFDRKCFSKIHPKTEWKSDKKQVVTIEDTLKAIEKKKRGRPKKVEV
jgi:hypothetical protein